jgi:hypothetical protein
MTTQFVQAENVAGPFHLTTGKGSDMTHARVMAMIMVFWLRQIDFSFLTSI